jgi:hypothetical protein
MDYQETGRFGRITKSLRKNGFENNLEEILFDSIHFTNLKKKDQTQYVGTVVKRMEQLIGEDKTRMVLFECGKNCCGKSWTDFAKRIYNNSDSIENFIDNLNGEELKYNTFITFDKSKNSIQVKRTKCICGLINKGEIFSNPNLYCNCSEGHMAAFFSSILSVDKIVLEQSIYNGNENCVWEVLLAE